MPGHRQVYQYLVIKYSSYWVHGLCPAVNDTSPAVTNVQKILMVVLPSMLSYETDRTLYQKTYVLGYPPSKCSPGMNPTKEVKYNNQFRSMGSSISSLGNTVANITSCHLASRVPRQSLLHPPKQQPSLKKRYNFGTSSTWQVSHIKNPRTVLTDITKYSSQQTTFPRWERPHYTCPRQSAFIEQ